MKRIAATIVKEWQLMRRDIAGLGLLLLMPAALIIVMALVQDAPFKDYQELKFDLLVADTDQGTAAQQITDGLKQSRNFRVTNSIAGQAVTEAQVKKLVADGRYKIGVVIPTGLTAEMVNAANVFANEVMRNAGSAARLPAREVRQAGNVSLYFDPVTKPAFRTAITSALDKYISYSSSRILMQRLSAISNSSTTGDTTTLEQLKKIMQATGVKEVPLGPELAYKQNLNSVQHNVPAWAIFGMFFIAIPIAGHIIREREDGSAMRIALIPRAASFVAIGKILFYTFVCMFQFAIMLCIGIWILPLFGLSSLYLGAHPLALLPVCACVSFAATAYGFFTGSISRTINQAMPLGSVSIVILSAVGGIWVPIEILSPALQHIAVISPLHWALEGVNEVILRNKGAGSALWPCAVLLATGGLLLAASAFAARR